MTDTSWIAPVATVAGVALTVLGASVGAWLTYRVQKAATKAQAENSLVDQLQEELSSYRATASARATAQDQRMERIESQNDAITEQRDKLRSYAHDLRGHIFDQAPPPPPEWPDGIEK